jgi:hypothetical protein
MHSFAAYPLYRWRLQEPAVGSSDYFILRKNLLQNIFYILASNFFSKWNFFIENGFKLINSLQKYRNIENIFKKKIILRLNSS